MAHIRNTVKVEISGVQGCGKTRLAHDIIDMLIQRGYGYKHVIEGHTIEEKAAHGGNPTVEITEVQAKG